MNEDIDAQLTELFGRWTFATAQVKRLSELKADPAVVEAAARSVVKERGYPERQRAIVDALDDDTAAAVCIWLRNPANASSVIEQAKPRARKARAT